MDHGWMLRVAVGAALTSTSLRAQDAAPEGLTTKVRALCGELSALGIKLPDGGPPIEVLAQAEFEAGIAREQELVLGAGHFEGLRLLREALTLSTGRNVADLRVQLARAAAKDVACRYDFERGKLTVAQPAADALAKDELALVHELARAWRDQQSDLVPWFGAEPHTTEMARVRQCLLEGQAGVAMVALVQARAGKPLDKLPPEAAYGLATVPSADLALNDARIVGRDLWVRRINEDGWAALESAWSNVPASTEQVLHAPKANDQPRAVELPAWPENVGVAEVVRDDTLGELEIQALLLEAGLERSEAALAAIGWDGDRLQLLRSKSGDLALVWRIRFDRPEDVRQFSAAWSRKALGQMGATAQTFDWVRSDSVRFANALGVALNASAPKLDIDEKDRASTEVVERAMQPVQEGLPRLEGDRWIHPRFGVSIAVPVGWLPELVNGQPYLMSLPHDNFRDLIGVVALENTEGRDLAKLLAQHRTNITNNAQAKLVLAEQRKIGGKDVLYLRYDVDAGATGHMHLTSVVYLLGAKQVIVTATIADTMWPAIEHEIDKIMNGLEFQGSASPPKPAGR